MTFDLNHFVSRSFLDDDFTSALDRQVDGRGRRNDVEGNVVVLRQHCQLVRSNLVGGVAVRRDAVSTNSHSADLPLPHEHGNRAIADERGRDGLVL